MDGLIRGGGGWMDWISGGRGRRERGRGGDWIGFCLLLVLGGGVWANWELGLPFSFLFFFFSPRFFGGGGGWMDASGERKRRRITALD